MSKYKLVKVTKHDDSTFNSNSEPIFVIRAKDRLAPQALLEYAQLMMKSGNAAAAEEIFDFIKEVIAWQNENPDLVKEPD